MKRIIACVLCLFLLCGCAVKKADNGKPKIVTTVFPIYDFVRAIVGDTAQIKLLIKPGCEVHAFEPSPSDMAAIENCDLFAFIGGESDSWVENLLGEADINTVALIERVNTLKEEHSHSDEHLHHHAYDEHIWTSPENAVDMVSAIADELCEIIPENAEIYRKNAKNYIEKIRLAADKIKAVVAAAEQSFIVVADRFPFAYFTDYFGIGYEAALDGCAAASDVSVKTVARLLSVIKERQVDAVCCTELSNRIIANAVAEQTGARVIELHSAHNVTKEDFYNGTSYVDIMIRNEAAIREGIK